MCGRFALHSGQERLELVFDAQPLPDELAPEASWNVVPSRWVPVVVSTPPAGVEGPAPRHMRLMQWGLLPHWAKEAKGGRRPINARSETAHEKPMFRSNLARRRCLIPADGWFEWQETGGTKQPHFIHPLDERPLGLAGIWGTWSSTDGDALESFTILTTSAAEHLAGLHERMPVIIPPEDWQAWLDPETAAADVNSLLSAELVHAAATVIDHHPVGTEVNRPQNDHAGLIEPLPTLD
jgi:putative SOS response-associated peptidase YedK